MLNSLYKVMMLLLIVMLPRLCFAEVKTFTKEYTYQASEFDSKSSSRTLALEQVKRLLLEELGTFLKSETEAVNSQLTKDKIISITAGIVTAQVVDEKWDGQKYWLKAKLEADPSAIESAINTIINDTKKTKDLEAANKRIDELTKELDAVKNDSAGSPSDRQSKYNKIINRIKASDMMREYYAISQNWKTSDKIKYLTEIIALSPEVNDDVYFARAYLYKENNSLDKAEADYKQAIALGGDEGFHIAFAYAHLADIYLKRKRYQQFIDYIYFSIEKYDKPYHNFLVNVPQDIFDAMVKRYPNNYKVYFLRGVSNFDKAWHSKNVLKKVAKDFNTSIKLNNKQSAIVYLYFAELYTPEPGLTDKEYNTYIVNIVKYTTLGLMHNPKNNISSELLFMRANYGNYVRGCDLTARDYETAADIKPDTSLYYKLAAKEMVKCNNYNQAIFYYKKAIEHSGDYDKIDLYELFIDLAESYVETGQYKLAIDAYNQAIDEADKTINYWREGIKSDEKMKNICQSNIDDLNKVKAIVKDNLSQLKP